MPTAVVWKSHSRLVLVSAQPGFCHFVMILLLLLLLPGRMTDSVMTVEKVLYKRRSGETSYSESFSIQVYNTIVWLRILLLYKTFLDDSADS